MFHISPSVTRAISRQVLVAQKHAPRAMFAGGIVGVISGTVLACRATTKLDKTVDTFRREIDDVKAENEITLFQQDGIPNKDYRRDLAKVYIRNTAHIARLYVPAAAVTGLSIAALTGSHVVLSRRNASVTAAYSALAAGFESYRARVREELGEERESDIHRGFRAGKVDVDGKSKNTKIADPNHFSIYARIFDAANPNWDKHGDQNLVFLRAQQNYFNNRLQTRGHVFLNEVLDALGFEDCRAGQAVGWLFDKESNGDNYIDFGLYQPANAEFVNGYENVVWLDFNVDGVIWDNI